MELIYLWIERYNNIINQEFRFSKELDIKFDLSSKKLEISRSDFHNVKLFDKAFLNVTAIIGKNGSGKTSLLTFLKLIFSNQVLGNNPYILVLKVSNQELLIIDKFSKSEKKIIFDDKLSAKVKIDKSFSFQNLDLIFHSNSFSIFEKEISEANFLDISLNYSLNQYSKNSNRKLIETLDELTLALDDEDPEGNKVLERSKDFYSDLYSPQLELYRYDLLADMKFISDFQNENWRFIPKKFELTFSELFFYNNRDYFENRLGDKLSEHIRYLLFIDNNVIEESEYISENFKHKIIVILFLYYLIKDQYNYPQDHSLKPFIKSLSEDSNINDLSSRLRSFIIESSNSTISELIKFCISIDSQFNSYADLKCHSPNIYSFNVSDGVRNSLSDIFDIWLDKDFIFSFDWMGLSAGESALLTIFSKINFFKSFSEFKRNIWILIDEGDLYLHPEWQRSLFSELHKYLPLIFKDKNIQLFLTTHSPFIVSDLPKENIILLDKEEITGLCKVVPPGDFEATFGSNIHELFAHTFFMEKGTIGEFAKGIINDLFNYLTNKEISKKWDQETAKNAIEIIGEPIIKDQLLMLYDIKFDSKSEAEYLRVQKARIDARLKELE